MRVVGPGGERAIFFLLSLPVGFSFLFFAQAIGLQDTGHTVVSFFWLILALLVLSPDWSTGAKKKQDGGAQDKFGCGANFLFPKKNTRLGADWAVSFGPVGVCQI